MRPRAVAAVSAFAALVAAPARADTLWNADFETGDLSQLQSLAMEAPDRLTVAGAPDPVWAGDHSLRFEIRDGDVGHPNHGHKVAAGAGSACSAAVGTEAWFSWRLWIPADYPPVTSPQAVSYWRARGTSPHADPIELRIEDDTDLGLHVSAEEVEIWRGPYERGAWNEIVLHARFDVDPDQGFVELRLGGELVLPKTPAQTMAPRDDGGKPGSDWQFGIFPLKTSPPTYVLHADDFLCGDTLADVQTEPNRPASSPDPEPRPDAGAEDAGSGEAPADPGAGGAAGAETPDREVPAPGSEPTASGCAMSRGAAPGFAAVLAGAALGASLLGRRKGIRARRRAGSEGRKR